MSARPDVPRLAEEDLDLLISRSLDGDLSPEEEQQLERLVDLDPAAARRKAELSALVADVKALPEPATPFALSTRVNSNLSDRAGRPGSLGGRVGFFPAPGFAKVALVILGIVGAAIAILRPVPQRPVEGPVDVLLYSPARPASPAPQALVAEAKPDSVTKGLEKDRSFAPETDARRNEAADEEIARSRSSEKKTAAKRESAADDAPAAPGASNAVADAVSKQKVDRDDGAAAAAPAAPAAAAEAPAKVTSLGALAPRQAAPAAASAAGAPARDGFARTPSGWTVSVRGDAVRRWSLRRAPDNPPPAHGTVVYRVTIDASGRVSALSRVGAAPPDPRIDAFVRGMVFEPVASRAEAQSRVAAKDAGGLSSADFEIELTPR